MIDVLGREVHVGDVVSVATRVSNTAAHRIGTIYEIDDDNKTFRIIENKAIKPTNLMYQYFYGISRAEYNKVVLIAL